MASHTVDVQTVEEGTNNVSITGMVDGRQTSAVVSQDDLPTTKVKRRDAIARALAVAFEAQAAPEAQAVGVTVEV